MSADATSAAATFLAPGPAAPAMHGRDFDPAHYLRRIRGRGGQTSDYLDVRHRLLWLRTEHPDAQIVTELIQIDDRSAVFKAYVGIPGGGSATGHGSESVGDFADYVEKAETKALGRALNALGFGAQFAESDGEETRTDVPQPRQIGDATRDNKGKGQEWTLFWEWARGSGFKGKVEVESTLGRSIDGLSPADLQRLLAPRVQALGATA